MSWDVSEWAEKVRNGDVRASSRALTAIENHAPDAEELLRQLFANTFRQRRVLNGNHWRARHWQKHLGGSSRRVSSQAQRTGRSSRRGPDPAPYSGGAILGDRIRMQGHASDTGIFIRSMATRGFLGGLARATAEVALLLDAAGKRQVLIETVGVGQDRNRHRAAG